MKKLLVISNHPPEKWAQEQKTGWDEIVYYQFPQVDPAVNCAPVIEDLAGVIEQVTGWRVVDTWANGERYAPEKVFVMHAKSPWFVCIQGDFSVTAGVAQKFCYAPNRLVFPTTERVVEEKEDGTKVSVFQFVTWRTSTGKLLSEVLPIVEKYQKKERGNAQIKKN
ncbi:MAG: hypothetical protein KatS3mg087_1640 [Patescibacteria group bacterium]|nr:MAG: hypothetical protein KatS3mg087_1640 [Patescibacteria group bacterium]